MAPRDRPERDIFDAGGRGLRHEGLRRANVRVVLMTVGFNPGLSNAEIARISGLAPQTVSAILSEIEAAGLIRRGDVLRGRRGQPATPIYLRAEGAYAIGVEIGWRHVDVLLLDLNAQIQGRRRWHHDFPEPHKVLPEIARMTAELIESLPESGQARLFEMGIAMPSAMAIDHMAQKHGRASTQPWSDIDVAADLQQRTGLDVSVFNDGNAACWAELLAFDAPRPASFIYFIISRFVGAGIVGEGTLWEGPTGNSANLGGMLIEAPIGSLLPVHDIASIDALTLRLAESGHCLNGDAPEDWAWEQFGEVLEEWLADSAKALAKAVFNTTTVIETGLVVIDGVMPKPITRRLVEQVKVELALLPNPPFALPQILHGHVGALAPATGAAALTLYRRFLSRDLIDIVS